MTPNPGEAELLRFTFKLIFSVQMIVNLAIPAYVGVHDSSTMMVVIDAIGRPIVLVSSILTTVFLLSAFWARRLRVVGGTMHALLCLAVAIVSLRYGYGWSSVVWFAYAFGGAMLGATGWRHDA